MRALVAAALIVSGQADAAELTLERVFANPPLSGAVPRALTLAPDGRHIAYLKPREADALRFDLWVEPVEGGGARMAVDSLLLSGGPVALSEAELARRERARLMGSRGVVEYRWAPDGRSLLVPLDGDLWLAPLDGQPRRLTSSPESEVDAKLSPDGRFVSYARGPNLFLYDLDAGAERAVTTEGGGAVFYGQAEFVAQEEMKRATGQWWAPDSTRIAVARVDESEVKVAVRAAIGSDGTSVTEQRYPFAGTPNARVSLEIRHLDGREPIPVDLGADPDIYLARVDWLSPGQLVVQRQPRDQKSLDVLLVDAATGRSKRLFRETSATWINLHDNLKPLADGRRFLWSSERNGYAQLFLWDGAALRPVTGPGLVVEAVKAVDEAGGAVFLTGYGADPLAMGLYRVGLGGRAKPVRLTEAGFTADAVMDKGGTVALVSRSSPDQPPQVGLFGRDGGLGRWIAENRLEETPYGAFRDSHVLPRFGTITAADGQALHWAMLVPPGLEPGARAPVFLEVYGGPGVQRVRRQWGSLLHQYLVRRGFIVFQLDNRGSANRGVAFEAPIHRALGTVEVEDQLRAVAFLKAQPFVDPDRIAVYGWSYGGYMALRLLTKAPAVFAAGVSGAPVTDWRLYDTHYTERYLGNPAEDDAPYRAADVVPDAGALARPLLLIHGLADDNVVFDHSAKMMAALQRAGKPFDTMVYPGQTHGIREPVLATHLWRGILAFLDRYLGRAAPESLAPAR